MQDGAFQDTAFQSDAFQEAASAQSKQRGGVRRDLLEEENQLRFAFNAMALILLD